MTTPHHEGVTWYQALSVGAVLTAAVLGGFGFIFAAHSSQPHVGALGRAEFERTLESVDARLASIERDIRAIARGDHPH